MTETAAPLPVPPLAAPVSRPWYARRPALRAVVWARQIKLGNRLAVILAVAATLSGVATYGAFSGWPWLALGTGSIVVLLNINILLVLALAALVARRVAVLWSERRAGRAGSRLHVRLATLFGAIAAIPAIAMTVFSALLFSFGLQSWFSERVSSVLRGSADVARAYLVEHQRIIKADALSVANDINRQWPQLSRAPQVLESFIATQAAFRGLTEAVVFTAQWQVIAKTGYTFALQSGEQIPLPAIAQADVGEVAVVTGEQSDRVRALVKLEAFPAAYLYVGRFIDSRVLARVAQTSEAVDEFTRLEGMRNEIELRFTAMFVVIALLLLTVAIWIGLSLADRLADPLVRLIAASERIGQGDFAVRVSEIAASDEVSTLSRAFNRMTRRLEDQQHDLKSAYGQLDERRRFTETVLAGVSSGVIGLDARGLVRLPNRSAQRLLHLDGARMTGRSLTEVAPEFAELIAAVQAAPGKSQQREVQVLRDRQTQTFLARCAAERDGDQVVGFVLTFDDITELQAAQRKAAWADVARRIAHEIKNPLTPIQLSAERLKRKFADRLGEGGGLIAQCTETIVRHVGDIGRMVDEFSVFARMPAPVMAVHDLRKIVADAVLLQRNAFPAITFDTDMGTDRLPLRCDARQIGQALTNVLKNAVEAIDARPAPAPQGRIAVRAAASSDRVSVTVIDNGVGLPQAERHRLTEPYVTTRAKGTGLGLAIVHKILEDHAGTLTLADAPNGGATVTLALPVEAAGGRTPTVHAAQ
jgi:two-component system nitrogen regulation sensor histidine kinase NtrY